MLFVFLHTVWKYFSTQHSFLQQVFEKWETKIVMVAQMLPVPGSKVNYLGEKILEVLRVLAVFRAFILRALRALRVFRAFVLADAAMLAVFRSSILWILPALEVFWGSMFLNIVCT